MKIGSVNPVIGSYHKIQAEAACLRPQTQIAADRVELSHEALLFTEAFSAARRSMREAVPGQELRVNQIMERMRGGTYQVEVRDICDKLLS